MYVAGNKGYIFTLASELRQFFAIFQDNRHKGNEKVVFMPCVKSDYMWADQTDSRGWPKYLKM